MLSYKEFKIRNKKFIIVQGPSPDIYTMYFTQNPSPITMSIRSTLIFCRAKYLNEIERRWSGVSLVKHETDIRQYLTQ